MVTELAKENRILTGKNGSSTRRVEDRAGERLFQSSESTRTTNTGFFSESDLKDFAELDAYLEKRIPELLASGADSFLCSVR